MHLYILFHLISLLSAVYTVTPRVLVSNTHTIASMTLSKPMSDRIDSVDIDHISYDYDAKWNCCNYVDLLSIPDTINNQDLVVLQWNLRGLRMKVDDIDDFLNNTLEQKVGILIINETWLNNRSPPLPEIKGYTFIGKPRIDRKGGGIGFLIRKDIKFRRKEDLEVNSKVLENMIFEIKCKTNILICSRYRPPNTNTTELIVDCVKLLKKIGDHRHTNSIIDIDHNLDFMKHSSHNPTQLFSTLNLDSNMIPTITRPTRVTQCSATLIDNFFFNQKLQDNFKSGILINPFPKPIWFQDKAFLY